jgi:hypothetical protein
MVLSPCWFDGECESYSAGYGLEQPASLEDSRIRKAIVDDITVAPGQDQARVAQDCKVLTHVRDVASDSIGQIPNGQLTLSETLKDAQPLGVGQSPGHRGRPLLRCLQIAQFEHVNTLQQVAQLRK